MDKDERRPDSKYTFPNEEMIHKEEQLSKEKTPENNETLGDAPKTSENKA